MILLSQTACFGSFSLVKKIYEFNDGATSNKFVKSLLMWLLFIVPVYQISGFLDMVIFNLVEFWSGSNPISMNEGEIETQKVMVKGEEYLITATKNQFEFEKITNNGLEKMASLQFDEVESTWSYVTEDQKIDLVKVNENDLSYFTKEGVINVPKESVYGMQDAMALK